MKSIKFAAVGLDHRHIYGMSQGMLDVGCEFAAFWTEGEPVTMSGFKKRFPDVPRYDDLNDILNDASIDLILIASPPADRARLSILAMQHGKDVMLDKPGCLTADELTDIKATIESTKRIWSVNFSERFEVPAMTVVDELLAEGRIGKIVHINSMGPHRLNAPTRPDWFWHPEQYGGILGDIGTHQIDQFLHLSGGDDMQVTHASVGNFNTPHKPQFQDFGEMNFTSGDVQGYVRLDWYTPDAAPNWGDGRLFIAGTDGYIEVRKYMDVAERDGTDHIFVVTNDECTRIDASDAGTPYFERLAHDIRTRSETACKQKHTIRVMELAIQAQADAEKRGLLKGV